MLKIQARVLSQFAQIEGEVSFDNTKGIGLKKVCCYENNSMGVKKKVYVPIITGNGFRGMLRREALNILLNKLVEKGINAGTDKLIDTVDFNLMNAGGGNDYQAQSYEIEAKIRELNPLISIFGTSLAVAGKLSTPNFMAFKDIDESFYDGKTPLYDCKMPISENEDGALYSDIIHREYFCKKDDMFNGGDNTQYLTPDQIIQRREEIETSQKIRKEERDIKSTSKTKKEDIRTYLFKEYVIKGSTFYTYVEDINNDMTQLEKGLFILALENTITKKIGSHKSKGFGVMKYDILFDDGSKLSTEVDEITYKATLFKDYSKEIEETIGKAKQWLEDLSEENIRISDVLISKK